MRETIWKERCLRQKSKRRRQRSRGSSSGARRNSSAPASRLPMRPQLAARHDVDLHRAVELVQQGCPADLAFKILV